MSGPNEIAPIESSEGKRAIAARAILTNLMSAGLNTRTLVAPFEALAEDNLRDDRAKYLRAEKTLDTAISAWIKGLERLPLPTLERAFASLDPKSAEIEAGGRFYEKFAALMYGLVQEIRKKQPEDHSCRSNQRIYAIARRIHQSNGVHFEARDEILFCAGLFKSNAYTGWSAEKGAASGYRSLIEGNVAMHQKGHTEHFVRYLAGLTANLEEDPNLDFATAKYFSPSPIVKEFLGAYHSRPQEPSSLMARIREGIRRLLSE